MGTAFVVWGTTWRDKDNALMTEPKQFFAKIHEDAWPL